MMVAKKAMAVAREVARNTVRETAFEFAVGDMVRVDIAGRIVGRSEFEEGPPTFLVVYERNGRQQREWIVGDKLVADGGAQ